MNKLKEGIKKYYEKYPNRRIIKIWDMTNEPYWVIDSKRTDIPSKEEDNKIYLKSPICINKNTGDLETFFPPHHDNIENSTIIYPKDII